MITRNFIRMDWFAAATAYNSGYCVKYSKCGLEHQLRNERCMVYTGTQWIDCPSISFTVGDNYWVEEPSPCA